MATFEAWRAMPFAWGSADCTGFAIACVQASRPGFTIDLAAYDSREGAAAALASLDAGSVAEAMAQRFSAVPPSLAQRGDVGVVAFDGHDIAAVCFGPLWWAKSEGGLLALRQRHVAAAFRV